MPWQEFVTKMVDALVWPTVVIIVLLLFRTEVKARLTQLKSLKLRDVELQFETALKDVERASGALPGPAPEQLAVSAARVVSPRAEIVEAWLELEAAVHRAYDRLDAAQGMVSNQLVHRSASEMTRRLVQENCLGSTTYDIVRELQGLRNAAVHEKELPISAAEAERYARSCARLVLLLDNAGPEVPG